MTPDETRPTDGSPDERSPLPPAGESVHAGDAENLLAAALDPADDDVPSPADLAEVFPELEIQAVVGRGGMGVVYRARQTHLDRLVALKLLPHDLAADEAFSERFAREARALARLDHPNIVKVHEFGEREGHHHLMLEYVDGVNLRQALAAGDLTPEQALAIVPKLCDALQYAHEQGVVHRDVKPENVLIAKDGTVKITDFGLAKLAEPAREGVALTRVGQVMGTPHYMAPEQIEHPEEVDHRADIYSLGVVLYELLTGELPLGRFEPPSRKVEVDVRLDQVVLRALEKEREQRYQKASEVRTEIDGIRSTPHQREPVVPRTRSAAMGPSRLSKLAVASCLVPFLMLLLPVMGIAFAGPKGPAMGFSVLIFGGLLPAVISFVMAIVALIRIRHADGALYGTGFAIAGLVLPLLFGCGGLGTAMLWTSARVAPAQTANVAAIPTSGPGDTAPIRIDGPSPELDEVHTIEHRITELLADPRLGQVGESAAAQELAERYVAPSDRRSVPATARERLGAGRRGTLGLALIESDALVLDDVTRARTTRIDFNHGPDQALVTLSVPAAGVHQLVEFWMHHEDGDWWFSLKPIDVQDERIEEE